MRLSFGKVFFVYLPLSGAALLFFFFAFKYWYISLAALIFVLVIVGMANAEREERGVALQSKILTRRSVRGYRRQRILVEARCMNNPQERSRLWSKYKRLEERNKQLEKMENDALIRAGK